MFSSLAPQFSILDPLPPCEFRVPISEDDWHICHHPRVIAENELVRSGVCRLCRWREISPDQPRRRIGLGDLAAALIKLATLGLVKPCAACQRRRRWLNRLWSRG